MITPDYIDPAIALPAAFLLGLLALAIEHRARRTDWQRYASLDCHDGNCSACDGCGHDCHEVRR